MWWACPKVPSVALRIFVAAGQICCAMNADPGTGKTLIFLTNSLTRRRNAHRVSGCGWELGRQVDWRTNIRPKDEVKMRLRPDGANQLRQVWCPCRKHGAFEVMNS